MNIGQAKKQISNAVRAYLSTDDLGLPRVPPRMQRPLVLFGPPGVGKTAVVAQVADEMGINFVAYSITHHTRQSTLGLPFITSEQFDGHDYQVSDYTMSEILAAVYRARKESDVDEGILFLDEVNCVSETLAPALLQFLQYKTFGMHSLPQGWVICCAGNPLEYNRSAREFDPALLDRIKRIDVEPELSVWQDYARACGVHPAITTFLDAKPGSFYQVRAGVTGPRLVTARGWEDLSRMISAYECEGLEVDAELVGQYVQDDTISHEFFSYYQLFRKYEDDYRVASILEGQADDGLVGRAEEAPFDERVAVVGLLLDAVLERVHAQAGKAEALELAHKDLASVLGRDTDTLADALSVRMNSVRTSPDVGKRMDEAAGDHAQVKALRLEALSRVSGAVAEAPAGAQADAAKACFNTLVDEHALQKQSAMDALDNAFRFLDAAFGEQSQEALIMVTRLSADPVLVRTVAQHGSGEFLKHNKSLLLSERNVELLQQIEALDDSLQDTADHAEQEG